MQCNIQIGSAIRHQAQQDDSDLTTKMNGQLGRLLGATLMCASIKSASHSNSWASFSIRFVNLWLPVHLASWRHQAARLLSLAAASRELGNSVSHSKSSPHRGASGATGLHRFAQVKLPLNHARSGYARVKSLLGGVSVVSCWGNLRRFDNARLAVLPPRLSVIEALTLRKY